MRPNTPFNRTRYGARLRWPVNSNVRRHTRDSVVPSNQSPATLRNLGPRSEQLLAAVGITTLAQLRRLGSVSAYARVKRAQGNVSLNLLWALEGALTDLPWQVVAREHRTSLLLALEEHQRVA